jgi:hypothetical protein
MKTLFVSLLIALLWQGSLEGQTNVLGASAATNTAAAGPVVVGRSAHERVWGTITSRTNGAGQVAQVTNVFYKELGTGLCYTNAAGEWLDTVDEIDIATNGATATRAGHKVHFAGNANAPGGRSDSWPRTGRFLPAGSMA